MNDARFAREQRRGQNRQRRIFRAADLDGTRKRMAAVNEDFIHIWQKGTVSHLNNRFSNKCPDNFFPPGPKEGRRSGLVLFPTPAFHPGGAATAPAQSIRAPTHRLACWRKAQLPDRVILPGKECGDFVLRCKEDSPQSHRNFPSRFQGDCLSKTGPDRPPLTWTHSLARARAHRPKCRRRQPPPREISLPSRERSHRYRSQHPEFWILDFGFRMLTTRQALRFPLAEPSRVC